MLLQKRLSTIIVLSIVIVFVSAAFVFAGGDDPTGFRVKPALQVVTTGSVGMMWETWNSDSATIKISRYSNLYGASTLYTSSAKLHKVTLNGLSANTRYYYKITSDGESTAIKSFLTSLQKGSTVPFRFIVYGDSREAPWYEDAIAKYGDNDDHLPVLQSMMTYSPDFIIHVGDYVFSGNDMDDIYNFFDVEKDLLASYPVLPVYGNHEFKGGTGTGDTYMDSYLIPAAGGTFAWYSSDYGNCHFLVINTGEIGDEGSITNPGSPQYNFIVSDLQAAAADPQIDHIFVAMHCPLYTAANFGDNQDLINNLESLFVNYGVKVVFYGHEHDYQHLTSNGIHYILSGGAGSSVFDYPWKGDQDDTQANLILYDDVLNYVIIDVNGPSLNFQARSVQGNGSSSSSLLESFSL